MENYYIGIDIGGTNIKYILRKKEKIIEFDSFPSNKIINKNDLLHLIHQIISGALSKYKYIQGIGIGSKGNISHKGMIISSSWKLLGGIDLEAYIKECFSLPVKVINDARLPYYLIDNEHKKRKSILTVTLGTGVGVAIFKNNSSITQGSFSSDFSRNKFRNGLNRDFTSTNFLINTAKEKGICIKTPLELFEYTVGKNDTFGKEIFQTYGENLGEILSSLIAPYMIDDIYISGGIVHAETLFLENLKTSLSKYLISQEVPHIYTLKKPYDIGAYGASKMIEEFI